MTDVIRFCYQFIPNCKNSQTMKEMGQHEGVWCYCHSLTFLGTMDYSIKLNTYKTGWSIIYFPKYIVFLSLKIDFIFANSAGPDEMPHHSAF